MRQDTGNREEFLYISQRGRVDIITKKRDVRRKVFLERNTECNENKYFRTNMSNSMVSPWEKAHLRE
jgi:hypothetical protein